MNTTKDYRHPSTNSTDKIDTAHKCYQYCQHENKNEGITRSLSSSKILEHQTMSDEYYLDENDEVTFLLRLRPSPSPPSVRKFRRNSVDVIPIRRVNNATTSVSGVLENTDSCYSANINSPSPLPASSPYGWDIIVEQHHHDGIGNIFRASSPTRSSFVYSPPPPPLPPRSSIQPSAPPAPVEIMKPFGNINNIIEWQSTSSDRPFEQQSQPYLNKQDAYYKPFEEYKNIESLYDLKLNEVSPLGGTTTATNCKRSSIDLIEQQRNSIGTDVTPSYMFTKPISSPKMTPKYKHSGGFNSGSISKLNSAILPISQQSNIMNYGQYNSDTNYDQCGLPALPPRSSAQQQYHNNVPQQHYNIMKPPKSSSPKPIRPPKPFNLMQNSMNNSKQTYQQLMFDETTSSVVEGTNIHNVTSQNNCAMNNNNNNKMIGPNSSNNIQRYVTHDYNYNNVHQVADTTNNKNGIVVGKGVVSSTSAPSVSSGSLLTEETVVTTAVPASLNNIIGVFVFLHYCKKVLNYMPGNSKTSL
ncbi:myb-like protein A [Chrysoperla carnea]|uniref:myb-like protein A n=1 Tax=Chrysoperla carnea TaxID=189513 RepID=UPI001D05F25F|nr:myb-like protein A [Chrysoperla carnea]